MTDNTISITYIGYQCLDCGRQFSAPNSLRSHSRIHEVHQQYKCQDCGKTFKIESYYRYHCSNDKGEYSLECVVCGKRFRNDNCLDTHYKSHTNDKCYKCKMCGKTYRQLGGFRNHLTGHPKTFHCNKCGKVCTDTDDLEKHLIQKHKSKKPFVCVSCGIDFAHLFNLEIHMKLCSGAESFVNLLTPVNSASEFIESPQLQGLSNNRGLCDNKRTIDVGVVDDTDASLVEMKEERLFDTDFFPLEVYIYEGDEVLTLCESGDIF